MRGSWMRKIASAAIISWILFRLWKHLQQTKPGLLPPPLPTESQPKDEERATTTTVAPTKETTTAAASVSKQELTSEHEAILAKLSEQFLESIEIARREGSRWGNSVKLRLYGLFKYAKHGTCTQPRPSIIDVTGRAKWDAWCKVTGSRVEAMLNYIRLVKKLTEGDREEEEEDKNDFAEDDIEEEAELEGEEQDEIVTGNDGEGYHDDERQQHQNSEKKGQTFGMTVSSMSQREEDIPGKDEKDVYYWCQEGNLDEMKKLIAGSDLDALDEAGMGLLHWACDRGHLEIVDYLLQEEADISAKSDDGYPPIFYALECEHLDIVRRLLENGVSLDEMIEVDGKMQSLREIASISLIKSLNICCQTSQ